uniref:Tubulin--tyrosine ligase-like protein 12 n=1 Tax=Ditylenchus dipsaci TaxID=166011 RepID=A0A915E7M8_9BILA
MSAEHTFEQFIEVHEGQLLASRIPQHFWPSLYHKLKNEELDAGDYFQIVGEQNELDGTSHWSVSTIVDLKVEEPNNIFLIDHAWTFRPNTARLALQEVDGLKERLMNVFGIKPEDFKDANSCSDYIGSDAEEEPNTATSSGNQANGSAKPSSVPEDSDKLSDMGDDSSQTSQLNEKIIEAILDDMWKFAQTYSVRMRKSIIDEQDVPVWYLPDEFGMRIGHSQTPNVRMVPFFYAFQNLAYSLLYPLQDVADQEEITRNFLDNNLFFKNPGWYEVLMHPWMPFSSIQNQVLHCVKNVDYFTSGRLPDELPSAELHQSLFYSYQLFENLSSVQVEFVDDIWQANVVWLMEHFHDFKQLAEKNPSALINQFPYESVLTVKDLLAATIQSAFEESPLNNDTLDWQPEWLPTTFNLQLELPEFVAYFQRRQQKNLDNIWIIKPWNLARGLDTYVTKNLNCIIRMAESGPKIACKYIHNPFLFRRLDNGNLVKFDLRYIVFLKSVEPLELAIYDNFWIRFAVNEYSLNNLDDIFTHMSVHNYTDSSKVLNMKCHDFISQLEKLYPKLKWTEIQQKINHVIKEVFQAVTKNAPPRGIAHNKQSRAMYGLDIMLHWKDDYQTDLGVSFIEANFMPDCMRAVQQFPDFADTVFETLFLDKQSKDVTMM